MLSSNAKASTSAQILSLANKQDAEKGKDSVFKMLDAFNDIDKFNYQFS